MPTTITIGQLVHCYRDGDQEAAQQLLERFDGYLKKWVHLFASGTYDAADDEIRQFLSLTGHPDLRGVARLISRRLQAYETADLQQEVSVILLETARKHDHIQSRFRFLLFKRLKELTRDPAVFRYDQNTVLLEETTPQPSAADIDDSWVQGLTCGVGFDQLTTFERQVLRYTTWFGFGINRTAKVLAVTPQQVRLAVTHATERLADYFGRTPS